MPPYMGVWFCSFSVPFRVKVRVCPQRGGFIHSFPPVIHNLEFFGQICLAQICRSPIGRCLRPAGYGDLVQPHIDLVKVAIQFGYARFKCSPKQAEVLAG